MLKEEVSENTRLLELNKRDKSNEKIIAKRTALLEKAILALKTLSILVDVPASMQIIMTLFLVKVHFLVFVPCNQVNRKCYILRIFIHCNSELPQRSLTDFSLKSVQCRVAPSVLTDFVAKSVKTSKFFGDTNMRSVDLNPGQLWLIYICVPWFILPWRKWKYALFTCSEF